MKKKKIKITKHLLIFLVMVVMCMIPKNVIAAPVIGIEDSEPEITPIPTETPIPEETITPTPEPIKNGLVKENGYYRYYKNGVLQKNVWKKLNNRKYYFMSNGNAATYSKKIDGKYYIFNTKGQLLTPSRDKILPVGKYKFYMTTKGVAVTGWKIYNGKLYYMNKSGRCAASTTIDGVTFTKDCWAKDNDACRAKIKAMEIVAQITNSKMTQTQKLRACFNHTMSCRFVGAKYPKNYKNLKNGWYYTTGLDIMITRAGNCYGYASMFALLAKELGYTPYLIEAYVSNGGEHCFVKINGKYYDNMGNRFGTAPQYHKVKNQWKL